MKSLDISGLHGSWLRRYAAVLLALTTSVPGASTLSAQARPLIRATTITEATLGVPLTRIGGVAPGPNGVVALVPRPGPQMVLLRGNAKPLFFSRAGAGPGEVQYPAYMGWVGDTLWVGDDALKRISLFSVAGKLLRTIPVQIGDSPVYLRDGSTAVIPAEVAESWEKPAAMESIRRARNGKIGATILSVSMRRRAWTIKVGRSNFVGGQPFDDFPLWNSFGDGSGFVLVTRAMRSASDSYFVVERYNESGAMRFARRYSFVPIPLGRAEIDAAVAGAVTGIPAPDRAAVQARAGEALYRPISLPTISAVVAGSDGTIWLGREVRAGSPRRWTLLDPRGEVVGDFTVPAAFEVRAGSATGLWGVEKDGDGVPRVVEMRVR